MKYIILLFTFSLFISSFVYAQNSVDEGRGLETNVEKHGSKNGYDGKKASGISNLRNKVSKNVKKVIDEPPPTTSTTSRKVTNSVDKVLSPKTSKTRNNVRRNVYRVLKK